MPGPVELFIFAVAAVFTSAVTALVGLGGGIMLLAVLIIFIPVEVAIPVHGVAQWVSNISRTAFGFSHVRWELVWRFAVGALIGAVMGTLAIPYIPFEYLPILLGLFILVMTWWSHDVKSAKPHGTFFTLGIVQTALSFFLGATGPLAYPLLLRRNLDRHAVAVTAGAMISFMHLGKVIGYAIQGAPIAHYAVAIGVMALGVIGGSFVGTRLRHRLPETAFRIAAKALLTILAVRMILGVFA